MADILARVDEVFEQLQPVIQPGEHILWSGRSDPNVIFTAADGFLIPLAAYFIAFGCFAIWTVGKDPSGLGLYIGAWLILVGLFHIFARLYFKRRRKNKTAYAITNRRAIVLFGARSLRESAVSGGTRTTKVSRDGLHMTVTFGYIVPTGLFNFNSRVYPNTGMDFFDFTHRFPVAFYDVADVDGLRAALARVSAPDPAQS